MEQEKQVTYELTDLGWKAVRFLRTDRAHLRVVNPPVTNDPLQQAASTKPKVTIRIASDLIPNDLWDTGLRDFFYDEDGRRLPEGITLANYLLSLADFQEKNGRSPSLQEWGKAYASYGDKTVSAEAVVQKAEELVALGLVKRMIHAKRSAVITEEGREWLWKMSKYADIPSIMSNLMASGKISADDINGAMGDPDSTAKEKVLSLLGLDPIGRKPGTPTHLPL